MFHNWIDLAEPLHLLRRIRRDPFLRERLLKKFHLSTGARVAASWAHTESPTTNWGDIPAVQARWNKMISGDAATRHEQYVVAKYAGGRDRLTALSPGCGTGSREIYWAQTGKFDSIDACDLSGERIRAAIRSIGNTREASILRYRVADIFDLGLPPSYYDIVLFEHSLHHLSPLEPLLLRIKGALKPGGLLVANEFIGPSRFQWTDRQLAVVNGLLHAFPSEYTSLVHSRLPRLEAVRPSKLAMWLSDPSEACESSNIIPLLQKHFRVKEFRGYGGAILHLLFAGIAHHFINTDGVGQTLLDFSFAVEDLLLDLHEIDHDFALVVCANEGVPSAS